MISAKYPRTGFPRSLRPVLPLHNLHLTSTDEEVHDNTDQHWYGCGRLLETLRHSGCIRRGRGGGPALLHSRKALLIFANNPRFLNRVGDPQKTEVKHVRKEARLRFYAAVGRFVQGTLCGIGGTIMPFCASQPGTELPHIGTRTVRPCVQARSSPQHIGGEHED